MVFLQLLDVTLCQLDSSKSRKSVLGLNDRDEEHAMIHQDTDNNLQVNTLLASPKT